MNDFSLLIKPAAADCNLRCAYCFYVGRQSLTEPHPRMSDAVLERLIARYMRSGQAESYTFSWQGGEPGLMGLDFFKKVVELQVRYALPGSVVCNGLQTNGTLITDELAAFLAQYKFLFGVSLDGPAHLHDFYRKTRDGMPTHASVLQGIERLERHGVEYNILALVNSRTVKQPREIYGYFKNRGFWHQQYVPCVEFDAAGQLLPCSVTGCEWGNFLCEIFDRWLGEDVHHISIRLFDSILEYLVSGKRNSCAMSVDCRQYLVVEYDGSVYPCDFFVRDDLRLGSVMSGTFRGFLESPVYRGFGLEKANYGDECRACPWLTYCQGDCQKFRPGIGSKPSRSVLCEGWKTFYAHALPRLRAIADGIQQRREP
ncbi:MAG: anaerobic sulfatase maturase [Polyangiaceae bacterium]|nr:anaerobic sulfatase maturase [Polyangiaceae bacterium]